MIGYNGFINSNLNKKGLATAAFVGPFENTVFAGAYSTRRLRSGYTGASIRVRRDSDNSEMDIGFDSLGNLNTSELSSFASTNSCFVTIWYDQSGNGRNAVRSVTTTQPRIVNSGIVELMGSRPALRMLGTTTATWLTTGDFFNQGITVVSACRVPSEPAGAVNLFSRGNLDNHGRLYLFSAQAATRFGGANDVPITNFTAATNHVVSTHLSPNLRWIRLNNATAATNTVPGTADPTDRRLVIGTNQSAGASSTWTGWIGEMLVFQSDLGTTETQIHPTVQLYWQ